MIQTFKNKICKLDSDGKFEFLRENICEICLSYDTTFKKINENLNEDEIIFELKKFTETGGRVFIRFRWLRYEKGELKMSLCIELKYGVQRLYINDIDICFYNKLLKENFPIAENNNCLYQDMKSCSKLIEFYNNLSDEEKLRIELL